MRVKHMLLAALSALAMHNAWSNIDLYSPEQRSSTFEGCPHLFPKSQPIDLHSIDPKWRVIGLCSNAFAVVHSNLTKTPLLVVEKLSRQSLAQAKGLKRTDQFYEDTRVPRAGRAVLKDYARSGYDRGHLAPAADQPSAQAMAQSFALSNMVPQAPTNNREPWNKLEQDTRKYVNRAKGNVFVYSGVLFEGPTKYVGQVRVPSHLFKLIYDEADHRVWAHLIENTNEAQLSKPLSYQEFMSRTNWRFLTP